MKNILLILTVSALVFCNAINAQVLTIAEVQGGVDVSPYANKVVTIKGAVTGVYSTSYFMRDSEQPWSGIYVYDSNHKPALGDTVLLTATAVEYSTLTELSGVTSYTVISTGNIAPAPVLLSTADIDESWEGCLVTVENAKCTKVTLGYGEWEVNDGSGPAVVNDLGYPYAPQANEKYTIAGNISYSFGFYKIEPRFAADVQVASNIYITSEIYPDTIGKNELSLSWTTNSPGTTEVLWGLTPELELGSLTNSANVLNHSVKISSLTPATFYYVRGFSVSGSDTTNSRPTLYSTASESSGEIRAWFNRGAIPAKDTDPAGVYTSSMIDTMISFVNLAESTLDLALYDWTNFATFSDERNLTLVTAINAAFQRGVIVRFMTDATPANTVLVNLDPGIPILKVKTTAIMHDKFMIIDADNAAKTWLVSGSTNPTYNNLVMDYNNLIAIQDQSVAKAYALEFNEMYGSVGESPDTLKSLIGLNKKDNTPHNFLVNGKRVEIYFSPSDFTGSHIVKTLASAQERIDFAMMAFTDDPMGNVLVEAKARGIKVRGVIDYVEYSGSEYSKLQLAGIKVLDYKNAGNTVWPDGATVHHKFAVVDAGSPNGTVITGSHNWTAAADSKNDENTLIVHDPQIANLYRAESERIYRSLLKPMVCKNDTFETMDQSYLYLNLIANDVLPANYTFSIKKQPSFGTVTVEAGNYISYIPSVADIYTIHDTIIYQVCYPNDPEYTLEGKVFLTLDYTRPFSCTNDNVNVLNRTLYRLEPLVNDNLPANYTFSIIKEPQGGTATAESDFSISYISQEADLIIAKDTIVYQICDVKDPSYCLQGNIYIVVNPTLSTPVTGFEQVIIYPNPVAEELHIRTETPVSSLEIIDISGKSLGIRKPLKADFTIQMPKVKGVYYLKITLNSGESLMRKVVRY